MIIQPHESNDENNQTTISIPNAQPIFVSSTEQTLRNELQYAHAQIEAVHDIIYHLNECVATEDTPAYEALKQTAEAKIDEYEAKYELQIEFDL